MRRDDPCDSPSIAPMGRLFSDWRRSRVPDTPAGTITLLFTDIEGSTLLLQHVGEQYSRVLAQCRQVLRTAFQQSHGHEVDTQGDAFFFAFARATDAVAAAVAAQRALASHAWPEGAAVRVRIGLHTGEPQRTADGYVGLDVHLAARLMSVGHGGQVLLSQSTHTTCPFSPHRSWGASGKSPPCSSSCCAKMCVC